MDVRINARHCSITDSVREVAHARVSRLKRFEPRAAAAEIQFSEENAFKHADVRVSVPGAEPLQAHGEGDSFRSALDRSVQRLQRQLRRRRARVRERHGPRAVDVAGSQ